MKNFKAENRISTKTNLKFQKNRLLYDQSHQYKDKDEDTYFANSLVDMMVTNHHEMSHFLSFYHT